MLLNKYRVKPFARTDRHHSHTETHTVHIDTQLAHTTVTHIGIDRHTQIDSQDRFQAGTDQTHNRQRTEDRGNMKYRIQVWTTSWLNDSKRRCFYFFPFHARENNTTDSS